MYLEEGWMERWCRCDEVSDPFPSIRIAADVPSQCNPLFDGFPYFLDEEEAYEPPEDTDPRTSFVVPSHALETEPSAQTNPRWSSAWTPFSTCLARKLSKERWLSRVSGTFLSAIRGTQLTCEDVAANDSRLSCARMPTPERPSPRSSWRNCTWSRNLTNLTRMTADETVVDSFAMEKDRR